jgi:hypothetical protein
MKCLAAIACALLLFSSAVSVSAQTKLAIKPNLFSGYPDAISCRENELGSIFKASSGQNITVSFSGSPVFSGIVTNIVNKSSKLQYIAIKLPALNNATLAISKRIDENNNTIYIGHIISTKNADAYELKRTSDGNYQFVKTDLEKILPTCAQE